jgi:hypothetical protein
MSEGRELQVYSYVNRPYDKVVEALRLDAVGVFQRATAGAAERAESLASTLHVSLGPIEIAADVELRVKGIVETAGPMGPTTVMRLEWQAARSPEIFPTMEATLAVYPLAPNETQLDFTGRYAPPLGLMGAAIDAIAGHRIAEATVNRFVEEIAEGLSADLPA